MLYVFWTYAQEKTKIRKHLFVWFSFYLSPCYLPSRTTNFLNLCIFESSLWVRDSYNLICRDEGNTKKIKCTFYEIAMVFSDENWTDCISQRWLITLFSTSKQLNLNYFVYGCWFDRKCFKEVCIDRRIYSCRNTSKYKLRFSTWELMQCVL